MKTHEKIRIFREANQWSQEYMAENLNMSSSGYAKIERGETKLYIDKLQKIAQIFNINIQDLMDDDREIFICIGDNSSNNSNNKYHANQEMEKFHLIIQHKDEIIHHLEQEIINLKKIITLLERDK